ncbi:MAG: DUF3160 domain-containing protein [Acidimicrobiia bacterium]
MRSFTALLAGLVLVAASCSDTTTESTTTRDGANTTATSSITTIPGSTTTTVPSPAGPSFLRPLPPFAGSFAEIPLLGDVPAYSGPDRPRSLDGVLWADLIASALPADIYPGALTLLAENGFVVVEGSYGQFHEAYGHVSASSMQPLFVTTDAAYHYWHLVFAKALRDTEQQVLLPALEQFALELAGDAREQADEYAAGPLAEPAGQVADFAGLLVALLELETGPFDPEVAAEMALIADHLAFATSPTTGAMVDYTLFVPRGHYASTPDLTRYFLAMSVLGQTGFAVTDEAQLATALLLARLLEADPVLVELWTRIYQPTAFLVGLADDYTPFEAAAAASAQGGLSDPAFLAEPAALAAVAETLLGLRQVAIDPENSSIRVMGTRFVLDSFILDQLVHPSVFGRLTASPLDVAAAFGSDWALGVQEAAGQTAYESYATQLETMRTLVAERDALAWAGTVYDAWLYAIQPMWSGHGAAYPDLMRSEAWAAKAHQAGFGSYTELKHDTVLYAKQAFAEGEFPPAPAEPRHWVEPEPVVYERLAAVARLMRAGLADRALLAEDVALVLDQLIGMYDRFARLAWDELAGQPISAEDNEWLETIGSRFELLWLLTAESDESAAGGFAESADDIAAVVVDIMSNPTDALEIATGEIDLIYVIVPADDGRFQVARGGVYSYYEFWVPRDQRMTDEEWRLLIRDWERVEEVPDRPPWTDSFLVLGQWD